MRRIFRDNWAWRAGLALDELRYAPDDGTGPWPFLVSVTDTVALQCARDAPGTATTAAAAALCLLSEAADGLHGRLAGALPRLAAEHAALLAAAGRTGVTDDFAAALRELEAIGVLRRDGDDVVLLRPRDPRPEDLLACRRHMDDVAHRPENRELDRLLTRLVRRVERDGPPARRFRELAESGRLRVTVSTTARSENPDGLYDVGPGTLPSLDLALNPHGRAHALRGWVGIGGLALEGDWGPGSPVLLATYELAALCVGRGVGPNVMRRATRACGLWLQLLARTGGRTGTIDTNVSALAVELGALLGLAPTGDHRALTTTLLDDLGRAGAIRTARPARKTLQIELLHPPAPSDAAVVHLLRQWAAWRLTGQIDPTAAGLGGIPALAAEHLRRARGRWEGLLEARAVRVDVLPAAAGTTMPDAPDLG